MLPVLSAHPGVGLAASKVLTFYEFFAGGGMARLGLGTAWRCLFANEIDEKKAACYRANFPSESLLVTDVALLKTDDLPGKPDLAWASFPCQDLSLAGNGAGLRGARSGTFWPFWKLIEQLVVDDRAPRAIVLENVCGALRSHQGRDFGAISDALTRTGYRFGALVIDAVEFLPQSRPRLFIIAHRANSPVPSELAGLTPDPKWTTTALIDAHRGLSTDSKDFWVWWSLPAPSIVKSPLSQLLEEVPSGVHWHSDAETQRLLRLMSQLNRNKVRRMQLESRLLRQPIVGTVYKRTRTGESGEKQQRAEVRFDEIAGCLRTPVGGSSRQIVLTVKGEQVRSRLLSPREAARLMGLPDDYSLPVRYNDAYHVAGDGLAVPVVNHLATHLLEPLLADNAIPAKAA